MRSLYHGQSLIGLMLSLSLSSLLLLVVIQFYGQTRRQNQDILFQLHLQSELQRTVQLIGKDLRRVGFRAVAEKLTRNNLMLFEQDERGRSVVIAQADGEKPNSCILFFYDLDATGCIGTGYKSGLCLSAGQNSAREIERELFGYRLHDSMLETRLTYKNTVHQYCTQEQCRSYIQQPACNSGGWVDLLDDSEIAITHLQFDWLIAGKAVEVRLAGRLKKRPEIRYDTGIIVPLINQEAE
ncbi:type II secretion system protein J [Necropsobacter massiliensis]|uniref:type II secretion system protein J n=1 Tax=Necropsobacter massiliensis TaxID=1400001 RepID=UPI000595E1DC|nr:type II secretion system protein J [Necropsobacter massiliensis]